jgi:hypothetical protein
MRRRTEPGRALAGGRLWSQGESSCWRCTRAYRGSAGRAAIGRQAAATGLRTGIGCGVDRRPGDARAVCCGRAYWRRAQGDGPAASRREGADGGPAAADGQADGERRPEDGASRAIRRGRPSPTLAATQSRTGTSPGRASPRGTSSTSVRPRRTAPFRPARPPRARPAARTRRRQARPRREGRTGRSILPWRGIERACETCADPPTPLAGLWTRRLNLR